MKLFLNENLGYSTRELAGVQPTKWLAKQFDKKSIIIWFLGVIAISLLVNYWVAPENLVLIFTTQLIFSLASVPIFPLTWSILANTSDYFE